MNENKIFQKTTPVEFIISYYKLGGKRNPNPNASEWFHANKKRSRKNLAGDSGHHSSHAERHSDEQPLRHIRYTLQGDGAECR